MKKSVMLQNISLHVFSMFVSKIVYHTRKPMDFVSSKQFRYCQIETFLKTGEGFHTHFYHAFFMQCCSVEILS